MRVFFSLVIFSFMLATCQATCIMPPEPAEGELPRDTCVDPNDNTRHLSGSEWKAANCTICQCFKGRLSCCLRYDYIPIKDGCESVLNKETCEYEFYRLDDPSQHCDA